MRNHHPNGVRPAPVPSSLASLDVGRQALLLDLLTELAQCQEPEAVWAVLATRLKWLLDFERCDVAVVNPDHQTYHLRTVFDARPAVPHVDEAQVPLAAGLVGVLLLRGTASVVLDLSRDPIAALADPWLEGGALASVLTVRVHVQGQTVGAFHLGRVLAGGYGAVDIALAEQVAGQLGVMLAGWAWQAAQHATASALHQSEALNQQLLESSGDAISILDLAGHLLLMNRCGQRAWDLDDLTPVLGGSWVALWADAAPQAAAAVAAAANGDPGHFEGWYRTRRAATLTWWDVLVTPILDRDGHPDRLLTIARDVTARKAAEHALQQSHDLLDQRVQERTAALEQAVLARQQLEQEALRAAHFAMLGRLAAGLSHEIRNPLGAVFLHVDVLTEELQQPSPDSPAQVAEALTEIKTQLARLDDLVQDYLSLVRLGSMARTVQDLGAAVQAWGAELQPALAARGGSLQMQELASLGHVAFHSSTLRRVLTNLVQNAGDALSHGGTVTLTGQGTATHVQLMVHDTGSGIAAEQLDQIFEPLYTTKPGGTGLGLYLAQQIVVAHEGQLTVQSVVGQETVFTITLPRQAAALHGPGPPDVG